MVCACLPRGGDLQVRRAAVGDADGVARRLAVDGRVADEARRTQRTCTDTTLEVARDALEHDVAAQASIAGGDASQCGGAAAVPAFMSAMPAPYTLPSSRAERTGRGSSPR